jgi:hypothetical protein
MNRKAYILVLAVFVLGVVIGGLAGYTWTVRAVSAGAYPAKRPSHLERLTLELSLTPAQQQQVRAILNLTKAQFDATYDTIRPQMDSIRQQGRRSIRALLTQQQLPRFEQYLRNLDQERRLNNGKGQ